MAASIGQRLLTAGRPQEALAILKAAARKRRTRSREEWADDLLDRAPETGSPSWEDVWVEALLATQQLPEAQHFRWSRFERSLDLKSLRSYLKALPDFEDFDAEEKAMQHVSSFPHFANALQFLIDWPNHLAAAHLILQRSAEVDGNLYFLLDPAAKALEAKHPEAATLLYRAMIEDTLQGAKSTRYGHAARHLLECQSLVHRRNTPGSSIESHAAFLARMKATHGRKTGFWSRVADSSA